MYITRLLCLLQVKDEELEKEHKIQEALEKIQKAQRPNQPPAGDLLLGIYVNSQDGDCITLKVLQS